MYSSHSRIEIWLYENSHIRFEGKIKGFDEFMNVVIEDCEELNMDNSTRVYIGRILLKGDNISLIREVLSSKS